MEGLVGVALQLVLLAELGWARGPHHPHAHHRPRSGTKLTADTHLLQDTSHIQEDLGKSMKIEDLDKMTPEELEFHYFKVHDYDNNTKLDGLEILEAIRHTVEHGGGGRRREELREGSQPYPASSTSPEDFNYFVELIDQVLEEDDQDQDGYLSYSEYVVGRQRADFSRPP